MRCFNSIPQSSDSTRLQCMNCTVPIPIQLLCLYSLHIILYKRRAYLRFLLLTLAIGLIWRQSHDGKPGNRKKDQGKFFSAFSSDYFFSHPVDRKKILIRAGIKNHKFFKSQNLQRRN